MDKDKVPVHGGGDGFPTPTSRFSAFAASSNNFPVLGNPSPSSSSQSNPESSHGVSHTPDFPPTNPGHRRAHSEILGLPDETSFLSDLGVFGPHDGPSLSDDANEDLFSAYLDIEKLNSSCALSLVPPGGEPSGMVVAPPAASQTENLASGLNERLRARHRQSQSMDGSSSLLLGLSSEGLTPAEMKKTIAAAKLADLALVDPKRAKRMDRIWANRQSAARSKERKIHYIVGLEQKVQSLQTEAAKLSAQLTMLQRDANGLIAENSELSLRLQTMEQQVRLQDALNDALTEEVQRLKLAMGQMMPNAGPLINLGRQLLANQQFYHHNQAMQSLMAAHQLQRLQFHRQHQQQLHPLQSLHKHPQPQQQQPQPPANLRMKCPMTSQNQKGEETDSNSNWKQ